jgi:hypothetical protein
MEDMLIPTPDIDLEPVEETADFSSPTSPSYSTEPTTMIDHAPAPPPNFDEDSKAVAKVTPKPAKPVFGNRKVGSGNGRNGHKTIIVEVKPVGNWQHACRQSVKLAHQFDGGDDLSLRLAGQNMVMDFPDTHTQFCPELVNQLERLPGILRVYAV